jgi:fucose permease
MGVITLVALGVHIATPMPGPSGEHSFVLSQIGPVLGKPALFLLAFFLFLYVACEVGVWNWLAQHLISKGVPESKALNILSLGFALGLLFGRFGASRILISVPELTVMTASAMGMAITTYLMLKTSHPNLAGILVFLAGVSMAPVFPTTLAVVANAFPQMASTALGIVIACGWLGLAVSSRIIGAIAGGESKRLGKALMIIPAFSVLMLIVSVGIRYAIH